MTHEERAALERILEYLDLANGAVVTLTTIVNRAAPHLEVLHRALESARPKPPHSTSTTSPEPSPPGSAPKRSKRT